RDSAPVVSCCLLPHATATPGFYTLSLHDALPISMLEAPGGVDGLVLQIDLHARERQLQGVQVGVRAAVGVGLDPADRLGQPGTRSEEHTSELQSRENLVCRLLLEKKKNSVGKQPM